MIKFSIKNKHLPTANCLKPTICALIFLLFCQNTFASNFVVEKRIAAQLAKNNVSGNVVWLNTGEQQFLSIYLEANSSKARGGIILLHGMAGHPDWSTVISPLRKNLPQSGWATLSLQMPVLANDASVENYIPLTKEVPQRITAAIEFFHSKGIYNVAIIGHGLGATMGASYLASESSSASVVKAFVGIGLGVHNQHPEFNPSYSIAKIKIPFLDLFGSLDLESVKNSASTRQLVARKVNNLRYRQTNILGADHFFTGLEKSLVNRVNSWLKKFAPSVKFGVEQLKLNTGQR